MLFAAVRWSLLALSDVSLAFDGMSAIGATTDIGQTWGEDASVANDPSATLGVHCDNGFDASFSPYQSTRLSRYNPVS
jgi:hypothetical protein